MESDIEEGEIIEEANSAKKKQRQKLPRQPKNSKKRTEAQFSNKRLGDPTRLRSAVVKSTAVPVVPKPQSKPSVSRPNRIYQRHENSSDSKRSRRISRSPSAELPRQYRNRLQQNIHRRLESMRRSRSRSRTPPRRRIEKILRNPTCPRIRRIDFHRNASSGPAKKSPPPSPSIFAAALKIKEKSGEDSDDSIVSVAPPQKTPPLLIVLDSSHESESSDDEDVSELQLRKEALEALLNNYKDAVATEENSSRLNNFTDGLYSPYSPTPDDYDQCAIGQEDQDLRNELKTFNQTRTIPVNPVASIPIPLKERNGVQENSATQKSVAPSDLMMQSMTMPSSNVYIRTNTRAEGEADRNFQSSAANGEELISYPQFVSATFVPLQSVGTGDVDMRFTPFLANFNTASRPELLPTPTPLVPQQNYNHLQNYSTDSFVHNATLPVVPRFPISQSCTPTSTDLGVHMMTDGIRNSDLPFGHAFFDIDCRQNFSLPFASGWPTPEGPNAVPNPFQLPPSLMPPAIPDAKLLPPANLRDLLKQASGGDETAIPASASAKPQTEILLKHVINVQNDYHTNPNSSDFCFNPLKVSVLSGNQGEQCLGALSVDVVENSKSSRSNRLAELGISRRSSSKENMLEDIGRCANITSGSSCVSESTNVRICQPPHISPSEIRLQNHGNTMGSEPVQTLSTDAGKIVKELTVKAMAEKVVGRINSSGRDVDILISVSNDKLVPQRVPADDDSIIEDEEILRAQLLLDIARKKIINQPSEEPVNPEVIVTRPTVENLTAVTPATPSLDQSVRITKSFQNSRSKNRQIVRIVNRDATQSPQQNIPGKLPEKSLIPPLARPSNVGGLHSIKRTVINTNLLKKNVYNKNADPLLKNLTVTVANRVTHAPLIIPIRHDDSSSDDDDQYSRSSGTPSDGASPADKSKVIQTTASTKNKTSLMPDFETSLNNLLKNSRDQPRSTMQVNRPTLSPEALQHMTASKREEYLQLKRQIADAERRIKRKQEKMNDKLRDAKELKLAENLNRRIRTTSSASSKSPEEPESASVMKLTSKSYSISRMNRVGSPVTEIVQETTIESLKAPLTSLIAIEKSVTHKEVEKFGVESEVSESSATSTPLTREVISKIGCAATNEVLAENESTSEITGEVELSKIKAASKESDAESTPCIESVAESTPSNGPAAESTSFNDVLMENVLNIESINQDTTMTTTEVVCETVPNRASSAKETVLTEALLLEDSGVEISPMISFVPEAQLLETDSDDELDRMLPLGVLDALPLRAKAVPKGPMSKEREELYLREKLLKAALLKKMEDSSDMLLKRTERGVISSRVDINRELNALLSEMVKMSDLKVVIKSRQEAVLKLRKQLCIAEQKLESTMVSFQAHDKRRKSLTSKALTMRRQCLDLVKQCKSQGTKLRGQNYRVPSVGALEMKSKLVEVRKQNLVFQEDYRKLKTSIARLNSPYEEPLNGKYSRLQFRHPPSPSVLAANRLRRSVFSLRGKRGSLTVTTTGSKSSSWKLAPQTSKWHKRRSNTPRDYFEPSFSFLSRFKRLTKYGNVSDDDSSAIDMESVFLLPKNYFKDVLVEEPYIPPSFKFLPVVRYSKYVSPLESIRCEAKPRYEAEVYFQFACCIFVSSSSLHRLSTLSLDGFVSENSVNLSFLKCFHSDTPLLSKGVDPFTSLCFFELRGICNDSKCPFQHLYRSQPINPG